MNGRPRYKDLYLHQLQAAGEERDRANAAERELARLTSVLAKHGRQVLSEFSPNNTGPIELDPLEYECATAFIESNARISDIYWHKVLGMTFYTWRGRQLIRRDQ